MSTGQWLQLVEVLVLSATLLATVLISWYTARQTRRHFRLERTQSFISRFNSPEMIETRQVVDDWLAGSENYNDLLNRYNKREHEAVKIADSILTIANLFQELGVAFGHGAVDEHYTWDVFGGLVRKYWDSMEPFVQERRKQRERPTLLTDFEKLAREMRAYDEHRGVDQQCVYLFGYGSLIDLESASHTSSQPINREHIKPVWLDGYRRAWSVHAEARIEEQNEKSTHPIAFLNIEPDIARRCNGVLFKIPLTDLPRFDHRERVYERVNVTDQISPTPDVTVYTYVGRLPYTHLPPETKVAAGYENLVRNGAKQFGDSFLEAFESTTEPHQLPKFTEAYEVVGPDTVATVRGFK